MVISTAAHISKIRHTRRLSIEQDFQRIAHEFDLVLETPGSAWGSAWALLSAEAADGRSRYRYAYASWWDRNNEPTLSDSSAGARFE